MVEEQKGEWEKVLRRKQRFGKEEMELKNLLKLHKVDEDTIVITMEAKKEQQQGGLFDSGIIGRPLDGTEDITIRFKKRGEYKTRIEFVTRLNL